MTIAEKLFESLETNEKQNIFSIMDNSCPSDYGCGNPFVCDMTVLEQCFECWMCEVEV